MPQARVGAVRFIATELSGAYVLELERHEDERGFFARAWCRDELGDHGLVANLAQSSISRNSSAGTLRGMHYQRSPHEEAKLVRCTAGALFDVIVDLRPGSPTYTEWVGVELDAEIGNALFVPKGFAHGFQTLVDRTDVLYMISEPYAPEAASGVRWDDPAFAIEWPDADVRIISDRDRSWPDYSPLGRRRTRGA
jgi:dTDP-4-dehydrorhamnose 3,5-epimerase